MEFNIGDRVIFTNRGSWHSWYNGSKGTILEVLEQGLSYRVKMDEYVETRHNILFIAYGELTLIKED